MLVPVSVINQVKVWLNSQHIKVSLDWVEACVEFLSQEYQIQCESGSLQRLKNCVYEQWLAADLQEIGVQCLPPDLSIAQKTTLQGSYALQVNGVRDIGRSAYSQLKQYDGATSENAEVSATPKPFVPEWEAKPTRMLMMNLTDGINCVQGMEYKPISFLSVDLPVGVKVIIQGPIDCRFGVLLLTAEKIRVLGGEVEALIEKYSKEEILRETLQLKTENNEITEQNRHSSNQQLTRPQNESNMLQNTRSTPVHPRTSSATSHSSTITGSFTNPQSLHQQKRDEMANHSIEDFNDIENIDFDNFEDEDDDAFIKSLDHDALDQMEKESFSLALPENDDFEMSEDEEVYREVMALQEGFEVYSKKDTKTSFEQYKTPASAVSKLTPPVQSTSSPSAIPKFNQSCSPSVIQKASFTPSISSFDKQPSNEVTSSSSRLSSASVVPSKSSTSELSPSVNQKAPFTPSISPSVSRQTVSPSNKHTSPHNRSSPSVGLSKSVTSESPVSPKSSFTPSVTPSINKQPVSALTTVSSVSPQILPQCSTSSSINKQLSSPGHDEEKPYSNLSSVLENINSSSEITVTIKARIGAALSRLECSSTQGWQLTVKLHDGTGTIEAMIHDKVLEEFVSIPAKDMVNLQIQARNNVEVKNRIMEAVTNCKKKLQSLNCLMKVKFSPQLPKPCVIKCFL